MSRETYNYKRKAIMAARDFVKVKAYPRAILEELENAKTIVEIERIMTNARKTYL